MVACNISKTLRSQPLLGYIKLYFSIPPIKLKPTTYTNFEVKHTPCGTILGWMFVLMAQMRVHLDDNTT